MAHRSDPLKLEPDDHPGEAISEIAANLTGADQVDTAPGTFAWFVGRYEACKRVRDLAGDDPEAARRLAPPLLAVVRATTDRDHGRAEAMLLAGITHRTLTAALDVVETLSGPELATAYANANRPLADAVEPLATVVRNSGIQQHHELAVSALNGLAMARPEDVVSVLADTSATGAVEDVLQEGSRGEHWNGPNEHTSAVALAILAHRSSEEINQGAHWRPEAATVPSDLTAHLTAAIARELVGAPPLDRERLIDELDATNGSLDGLTTAVQQTGGSDRDRLMRACGEAAAIIGERANVDLPAPLVTRVRTTSGDDRERAARALGEVLAVTEGRAVEPLVDRVHSTTGVDYMRSTQALGEVVAATEKAQDLTVPTSLVARVQNETGATRDHAAQVLGEAAAVAYRSAPDTLIEALSTRVREAPSSTPRDRAARALCAVVGATDGTSSSGMDGTPELNEDVEPALGTLLANAGDDAATRSPTELAAALGDIPTSDRDGICRALGVAAADSYVNDERWLAPLVHRIRDGDRETRERAARALGEALLAGKEITAVHETLATGTQRDSESTRDRAARSLAEATIAAAEAAGDNAVDWKRDDLAPLRKAAAAAFGRERRRLTRALGESVAAQAGANQIVYLLAARAASTDGLDRARVVRALGEVALVEDVELATKTGPPTWMVEHTRSLDGQRRTWSTRALGEAILTTREDSPAGVIDYLAARVTDATGMDRVRVGRALGEAMCALETESSPSVPRSLCSWVAGASDAERTAAAIVVADLLQMRSTTDRAVIVDALIDRVDSTEELERTLSARALGEHVASEVQASAAEGLGSALLERIRGTDSERGALAAEALGLAVTALDSDQITCGLEQRLREHVRGTGASDDGLAARALGTASVSTEAFNNSPLPPSLVERVRAGKGIERTAPAWGLGVAIGTADTKSLAEVLVAGTETPPPELTAASVANVIQSTAENGLIPASDLFQALRIEHRSTEHDARSTRLRDTEGTLDHTLLAAVAAVSDQPIDDGANEIREDLNAALAGSGEQNPAARVAAVEVLADLPGTAAPAGER